MKKTLVSAAILTALLTGCGGGSSGSDNDNGGGNGGDGNTGGEVSTQTLTGVFIDSAVQGVGFTTATKSGTTNASGEFIFREGEEVTFNIGDLIFPTAVAEEITTPLDLAGTDNIQDQQVVNMVRLLMTLDSDGNPDNGIEIASEAESAAVSVEFDVPTEEFATNPDVLNLISAAGQETPVTSLVSEDEAIEHFQNSLDEIDAFNTYADFVGMYSLEADDPSLNPGYTSLMNIYQDGSYLMVEYYYNDEDSGIEYGDLGLSDGSFNPDIIVDTNTVEYGGLSSGDFDNVYMDGDTLHMTKTEHDCDSSSEECSYELTTPRVNISGNSIIGSWETQDGSASYNFRDDGRYFFAQIQAPEVAQGEVGMEVGGYTFDAASQTLELDIIPDSDTSGAALLADEGVSYAIHSATLSDDGDSLTLLVDYNDGQDTELILSRKL